MALRCGIKDSRQSTEHTQPSKQGSFAAAVVRFVGFYAMVTAALAVLAGVVLLEPYARLQKASHRGKCYNLRLDEAKATIAAMDRLRAHGPTNEVLTKRLAWSRLGMYPRNEVVVMNSSPDPDSEAPRPGCLTRIHYPAPPEPDSWMIQAASLVRTPARRNAMLVLAVSMFLAALLLFASPHRR